jgi:hypothetical protein
MAKGLEIVEPAAVAPAVRLALSIQDPRTEVGASVRTNVNSICICAADERV